MLAAQAMSLVLIKRHFENSKNYKLERDLFFVATPDEEHSGAGVLSLWQSRWRAFWRSRMSTSSTREGSDSSDLISNGTERLGRASLSAGTYGSRSASKVKGHGSQPWSGAIQKLIDGISRLRRAPFPVVLTPATRELLRRAAPAAGFPNGFMMERAWLVEGALTSKRSTNASVRNTCIETGLRPEPSGRT